MFFKLKKLISFLALLLINLKAFNQVSSPPSKPDLPEPYQTKSAIKFCKVINWGTAKPIAPPGFVVTEFAHDLKSPRWMYVSSKDEVFVAEANTEFKGFKRVIADVTGQKHAQRTDNSANRITMLSDTNKDGVADKYTTFLTGLKQPFGMLILNNYFYVANTDRLVRYKFNNQNSSITSSAETILYMPSGGYHNHWTRNIIASQDGSKIYVTVGSGSDHGEHSKTEERRANILEISTDGKNEIIYASGLRNPNGMAWIKDSSGQRILWTVVNERDDLGDNLVPDYFTSVKKGEFFGWPEYYWGKNKDPRTSRNIVKTEIAVPDYSLDAHSASLGLCLYEGQSFPVHYQGGAFISQHGSWNKFVLAGYKVIFIPFINGIPGKSEDFLTGFIADINKRTVYGRPVGVVTLSDGSLLVADDASGIIWKIKAK